MSPENKSHLLIHKQYPSFFLQIPSLGLCTILKFFGASSYVDLQDTYNYFNDIF